MLGYGKCVSANKATFDVREFTTSASGVTFGSYSTSLLPNVAYTSSDVPIKAMGMYIRDKSGYLPHPPTVYITRASSYFHSISQLYLLRRYQLKANCMT